MQPQENLYPPLTLDRLELDLRDLGIGNTLRPTTKFVEVDLSTKPIRTHGSADCVMVVNPTFVGLSTPFVPAWTIPDAAIADASFLHDKAAMMDPVSFIGYPGTSTSSWWDHGWNLAIARNAMFHRRLSESCPVIY
jgi:hypothetical protein